ncbi:arginine-tRNA ligase [Verruconis gallopava]|uniref:arginine--tRNA ligase n=1 Tax=Verruconis gallopava TaxID=253628 RepID=A0A0D2AZY2_9PEZI|nr:arginine-tRNA ligase [Verruconis gallopava]KIW04674.1 arginine-tRNA ligase [Verruconis gallopava]
MRATFSARFAHTFASSRLPVQVARSPLTHQSFKNFQTKLRRLTGTTPASGRNLPRRTNQLSSIMDNKELSHTQSLDELSATLKKIGLNEVPKEPNTYPEVNPVDIYRSHITELLAPLAGVDKKIVYQALQYTNTLDKGDLVLPVPALRIKGKKPDELANELAGQFPPSPLVEPPTTDKAYIKFVYKPEPLQNIVLPSILKNGPSFGFNTKLGLRDPSDPSRGRKKIIVEFSSPNIAKEFHFGHLRSTIIGGFISNLYQAAGWDVVRMNYLGDWGKQYGILALGFVTYGSEEELVANPIGHLFDVYVKISKIQGEEKKKMEELKKEIAELQSKNADATEQMAALEKLQSEGVDERARKYFKRMEDGDEEVLGLWKRFRALSVERYMATYKRLNIEFDDYSGESTVKESSMEEAARIMAEKNISEDSDGSVIVDFSKLGAKKLGKAVVKKKDGTSLYLTRDIGAIKERYDKYKFDKMIYVVAMQQDLHLQQLFKIVEAMGLKEISDKCVHINFGMVLGMSTRKGTVKFLNDILNDVGDYMHEVMKKNEDKYKQVEDPVKTADTLGISAVMVQDMTGKRINNYEYNRDQMTSFEGDTGPYLQYAHARLSSIIRKVGIPSAELLTADLSLLKERHAIDLTRTLVQWPDIFLMTVKTHEPVTVLTYLFKMTHAVSSSYDHLQVVGSEPELQKARMALYVAARQVLQNGMKLLGLTPLERM